MVASCKLIHLIEVSFLPIIDYMIKKIKFIFFPFDPKINLKIIKIIYSILSNEIFKFYEIFHVLM